MAIKYYSISDFAAILSVNKETIKRKIAAGEIHCINLFGMPRMRRIPETELTRIIKEGGAA